MNWERRSEDETPTAEQRRFEDEQGRTWVGTVRSGTLEGGEEHAEVVFVCEDEPSETKRVGVLDASAGEADSAWKDMDDERVREVFRNSEVR